MSRRATTMVFSSLALAACYTGRDDAASSSFGDGGSVADDATSAESSADASADGGDSESADASASASADASAGDEGSTSSADGSATASASASASASAEAGSESASAEAGSDTNASADSGGDGSVQQLCVDTINMYRSTLGLPPYARWYDAEMCSDGEAQSDSQTGQPHGAFGTCGEYAQNECPGWPAPPESMIEDCLAAMWAEGPGADFNTHGHYINMSSTDYSKVACGFHTTGGGDVWAVQNFQ